MSETTKIAWCDSTVNFWSGCMKVSAGCANCYAEGLSKRGLPAIGGWGKGAARKRSKSAVKDALAFNRKPWICDQTGDHLTDEQFKLHPDGTGGLLTYHRRRIFSLSLGDWLDDEVPIEWLAEMLDTIRQCRDVTWILCTKRPENFKERLMRVMMWFENTPCTKAGTETWKWILDWVCAGRENPPTIPQNIVLLTSVENQEQADKRIPELLRIPAACRGLSLEPLLGAVDLSEWIYSNACGCDENEPEAGDGFKCKHCKDTGAVTELGWLIIGGESGTNARPCNVDWIRSIGAQGKAAGAATFVKQLGANIAGGKWPVCEREMGNFGRCDWSNIRDKKGGDPSEWPADLRVQEWPKGF